MSRRRLVGGAALSLLSVSLAGCVGTAYPLMVRPVSPGRYALPSDVLFGFGSAALRPEASAALQETLAAIRSTFQYPAIRVEGHTDSVGSDAANIALSLHRAESVQQWLIGQGVPAAAISVEGFGKRSPVAPNTLANGADNPEGRARNRRVELLASPA